MEQISERIRTMWEICDDDQYLLNPSTNPKQYDLEPFFNPASSKESTMANAIVASVSEFDKDSGYFSPLSSKTTSPLSENEANRMELLFNLNNIENNSKLKQPTVSQKRLPRVPRINNNYCETVAVKSSAHVAQIVGKNGKLYI